MDRLNIIKEFFRTAQQFLKLEKVEIGGLRGKALSNRIICVHEEFKVMMVNFVSQDLYLKNFFFSFCIFLNDLVFGDFIFHKNWFEQRFSFFQELYF
jgi:hypothetical protein